MQGLRRSLVLVAGLFVGIFLSIPVCAQTPSVLEGLASQTAAAVAQSHAQHVLTVILPSCSLAAQICTEFDAHLQTKLEQVIPGIQFVAQNDSATADVLVNEGLSMMFDEIGLNSEIIRATEGKKLNEFKTKVASYPSCISCPDPAFPPGAKNKKIEGTVSLLVTITPQGRTDNITLVKGLDKGFDRLAMKTVRGWRFKPAVRDGRPIETRVPIGITLRLSP